MTNTTAIEAVRGLCRSRLALGDRAGLRRDRRELVARLAGYYGVAEEDLQDGKPTDEEILDEDVAALFDQAERQLEAGAAVGRER